MSDIHPRENRAKQPEPSVKAFSQGEQRAVMNGLGQKGGSFMAKLHSDHRVARNALSETDIELGIAALATRENVQSPRLEQPPTYGDSQREAITAIFTSMTEQVGHDLNQLRAKIDDLEQLMLTNASKIKADLEQQVNICRGVKEEAGRLHQLVDAMLHNQKGHLNGHGDHT